MQIPYTAKLNYPLETDTWDPIWYDQKAFAT